LRSGRERKKRIFFLVKYREGKFFLVNELFFLFHFYLIGIVSSSFSLSQFSLQQSSRSSVDVALITEAHGLVTDMLSDPTLPAHISSGLRAVASLLSPPIASISNRSSRSNVFPGVALTDFDPGEEPQEIPYTGEKLMSFKVRTKTKRTKKNHVKKEEH